MDAKDKEINKLRRRIAGLEKTLQIVSGFSGRIEKDLRQAFTVMSDTVPVPMLISLKTGELLFANEKAQEIIGLSKPDLHNMNVAELYVDKVDRAALHKILADNGEVRDFMVQLKKTDGSVFPASLCSQEIIFDGRSCHLKVIYDLSELKQAEEALRFKEHIIRSAVSIIATADLDGKMTHVNPSFLKTWNFDDPSDILGRHFSEFWMVEDRLDEIMSTLWQEGVWSSEIQARRKDGELFDVQVSANMVFNEKGEPISLMSTTFDITARKSLENKLRQAKKIESIGNLAGGIAHDFNNMLSIILGNIELIMGDLNKENPIFVNIQEIKKAAERSADLTRQLLAFARKQTIAPKLLDINKTIEGTLRMLGRLIGENIDLAWLPKLDLWAVKVDPSQVDQVLTNLCVNARDAIESVGKITIETDNASLDEEYCHNHLGFRPGDYVMISVSDNGCGMDKKTLNNIFEPFFTTKGFGQGTGLGLSTVYGIVKQNNGFINAYSEPGKGTTVKIYLPRYIGKESQPDMQVLEKPVSFGDETILLVEDEKAILRMTTKMLEGLGYSVLAASSPTEAIRIGESHPGKINLLMTDVVMPEMSGPDLAKRMSHLYPHLRYLFMSGYTADVIADHKVLNGGVHFLNKPFSTKELAIKVRKVFDDVKNQGY